MTPATVIYLEIKGSNCNQVSTSQSLDQPLTSNILDLDAEVHYKSATQLFNYCKYWSVSNVNYTFFNQMRSTSFLTRLGVVRNKASSFHHLLNILDCIVLPH